MPRKVRQPDEQLNLRRLNKFDMDNVVQGRKCSRKLHPNKYAKPGEKVFARIIVVNALVRDGATLREVTKLLNSNVTTIRNRYYGLADQSLATDDEGFFRMHIGACCDLHHVIDYENLPTFKKRYDVEHVTTKQSKEQKMRSDLYNDVVAKNRKQDKRNKKGPTLRELLYNKK